MKAVHDLHAISRKFGPAAANKKSKLLERVAEASRLSLRERRLLGETLEFMRAYPDDAGVLQRVRALIPRLAVTDSVYAYSYGVLTRLVRLLPGRLEIEWDDVEDESALLEALELLVLPGERQGLEDTDLDLRDWFEIAKPDSTTTDLELLIDLFERSPLPPAVRVFLFENADLPVRYRAPTLSRIELPGGRIHYQRDDIERGRFPLASRARIPIRKWSRGGQRTIDLALQALCARNLEIYPLIYANPADVFVAHCGRGLNVVLIGVLPEWRSPLECVYFFLPVKNGVPIAYGPAGVCLGCCEIGVNLFPEFRGAETRFIYAQIMRALHHHLGADYFLLTRYAMGEDNDDALRTGAFWFYRKLGFRPTNPEVEKLACLEEQRMAAESGYRSDRRTLRRLSNTQAYLDLSGGKRKPLDLGRLGAAESRFIAREFGGDRRLAERRCARRVARVLGIGSQGRAFRALAPLLCMIEELPDWSGKEKSALARILHAKDSSSEARAARSLTAHSRFGQALFRIAKANRQH